MKSHEQDFFERLHEKTEAQIIKVAETPMAEADLSTPVTLRNLFTHHDSHPVVFSFALLKALGLGWVVWENETLYQEIQRVFQTQISEHSKAKIQCVKTLHVASGPWEHWQVFEKIIQGLNNNIPNWELMQAPSLSQLYAGIDMMNQIRNEDFSDEVKGYIAAAILHENVFYAPPPLDFVQTELAHPYYHCKECGTEASALFHDGLCNTCTRKFSAASGLSMRPDPDALASGKGKDLELVLRYDPDPVQRRWNEIKDKPDGYHLLNDNSSVDIQVGRLLEAREYMNLKRKQLADQLVSLKAWLGAE